MFPPPVDYAVPALSRGDQDPLAVLIPPEPLPPPELPVLELPELEPPPLDLSTDRLDAQDDYRWNGRPLLELSDAELAAAMDGEEGCSPPPERTETRNQRNWLKLRVQWPTKRVHTHLRIDEVVLDWFRRDGPGFHGRMNAVLRAYVDAQIEAEARRR